MDPWLNSNRTPTAYQMFFCTGVDSYGDPEFNDATDHTAYKYAKVVNVINLEGAEETSMFQFISDTLIPVSSGSKVIADGVEYRVKAYEHFQALSWANRTGTTVLYL